MLLIAGENIIFYFFQTVKEKERNKGGGCRRIAKREEENVYPVELNLFIMFFQGSAIIYILDKIQV